MIAKLYKQNKHLSDFVSDIQILLVYLQSKSKKFSLVALRESTQKKY